MSAAIDRFRRMNDLDAARLKGVLARQKIEAVESELAAQQEIYIKELMANSRVNGEVYDAAVWKMVAIQDVVQRLYDDVARGDHAAVKLNEMSNAGGSE